MSEENDSRVPSFEVPQAVTDNITALFSRLTDDEVVTKETPSAAPQEGKTALQKALAEQKSELAEEGLEDIDGVETPATEKADEPVVEVKTEAVETPTELDQTLRLAAAQFGWGEEQINDFYAANPTMAVSTFEKLAETYTDLSRQYLAPTGSPVAPVPQSQQTPAQPESPTSKLDALYSDLAAFAEGNGEDIVERLLKPLKAEVIEPLRELMAQNQVRQQELSRSEARQSFQGLAAKFGEVYGADTKPLSAEQQEARQTLGFLADQLRAGAKMQGRDLSIPDAINRAHLIVSADRRDKVVRNEIKQQVTKRASGLTAKPTQRNNPALVAPSNVKASNVVSRFWADKGTDVDFD